MPGWGDAFKVKTLRDSLVTVGSATPAIFMSILLFILPQVLLSQARHSGLRCGRPDLRFFVLFRTPSTSSPDVRLLAVLSDEGESEERTLPDHLEADRDEDVLGSDLPSGRGICARQGEFWSEQNLVWVGRFCIDPVVKTIFRVVPGTCDLSDN